MRMKQIYITLEEIKNESSTKKKQEILVNALNQDNEAFGYLSDVLRLAYNDDIYGMGTKTFENILNDDEYKKHSEDVAEAIAKSRGDDSEEGFDFLSFSEGLKVIKSRSGDKQIDFYKTFLGIPQDDIKWFTRIILRDLRIGMGVKSVNKSFKKCGIKEIEKFGVQLAGKFETPEDIPEEYYPVGVSLKYDGFRCVTEKKGDSVIMTSRQGEIIDYFPELEEEFQKIPFDFIIDGEVIDKDFSTIQKRGGRKSENITFSDTLKYVVFDILKYGETELIGAKQQARTNLIENFITDTWAIGVGRLEKEFCFTANNSTEIREYYDEVCDAGEEGIIVKLLDRPYEENSRKHWMKIKPIYEGTFMVTGAETGTGKYRNTTGALYVVDGSGIICSKVGTGFTDEDREFFNCEWAEREEPMFIDVKFNEVTKNKSGKYSLRGPRFDKLRTDKEQADDVYKWWSEKFPDRV